MRRRLAFKWIPEGSEKITREAAIFTRTTWRTIIFDVNPTRTR